MERKAIYFNGDVSIGKLKEFIKKIPDSDVTDIVIGGSLWEEDDPYEEDDAYEEEFLEVPASLWVMENIKAKWYDPIKVHGDLYCAGNIDAYNFIVKGDFMCEGNVDIAGAEVGGNVTFKGNTDNNDPEIKCFGDFTCYDKCSADASVGGVFICEGEFSGEIKKL